MKRIATSALALVVVGFTVTSWRAAAWDPVYGLIALVETGTVAVILWTGVTIVVERVRRRSDLN
jgi:hypothetical protein